MARILVADDDAEAADGLAAALRLSGHAARTCYSGDLCLRITEDFRPDVVVLCREGIDAKAVRQLRAKTPVISIGAEGHSKEPLDMIALMRAIRQALA